MPTFDSHPTPNPDSLKLTTDAGPFVADGMVSFNAATEAEGHPLGERLFAIDGVANVFAMADFLTVTKTRGADWDAVLPEVEAALEDYFA
jgi:hypothetical protein